MERLLELCVRVCGKGGDATTNQTEHRELVQHFRTPLSPFVRLQRLNLRLFDLLPICQGMLLIREMKMRHYESFELATENTLAKVSNVRGTHEADC